MKIPRVMFAAASSGSGKTTITCGILQALSDRGLAAESFKCGPDYIDPMFHTRVIGTPSRNLDPFFCSEDLIRYLLCRDAKRFDISVLEGVMGYYDGLAGTDLKASSYDLARITETPVILIVNTRGMSRTVSALIHGMTTYLPDTKIAGVILNRMSAKIYPGVKELVERECGVPVLGYVPSMPDLVIESRHLGLVTPDAVSDLRGKLKKMAAALEETVDVGQIIRIAQSAPELSASAPIVPKLDQPVRVGVAKDEAFCFMYEDNLALFQRMGAELVPFSPLRDESLPDDVQGLIFPGGYPELFAETLSQNRNMLSEVRTALASGIPCLAECGGFMYLHEELVTKEGKTFPMVGAVPGKTWWTGKLGGRFGYITITARKEQMLGPAGTQIRAHEFHYFESDSCGEDFHAKKPEGTREWECIHADAHSILGYPHLYYPSCPEAAWNFLRACAAYR